ncbi:MAG: hypothetical protein HQM15_00485 [Deltaproteobacteria bacterium]|nr:hypothetical protein [Deltaproteobacteria bacterium]
MSHKILEAVLENGQIKQVLGKFPQGTFKVHIVYDVPESNFTQDVLNVLQKTSGLYSEIDAEGESRKIRKEWDRNEPR